MTTATTETATNESTETSSPIVTVTHTDGGDLTTILDGEISRTSGPISAFIAHQHESEKHGEQSPDLPVAPEKKKRGRPSKADKSADSKSSNANPATSSDNPAQPSPAARTSATQSPSLTHPQSPLEAIQSAMYAIDETFMRESLINSLIAAVRAPDYRVLFRQAQEQFGEAGIYRMLDVMIRNTDKTAHGQLRIAASQQAASARINGRGIPRPDEVAMEDWPSSNVAVVLICGAAKGNQAEYYQQQRVSGVITDEERDKLLAGVGAE